MPQYLLSVHSGPEDYARPLEGPFWTQPFGAALLLDGVSASSLRAFFEEGCDVAARG